MKAIRRSYYCYSPRGFANEYTVFVAVKGSEDETRLLKWLNKQDEDVNVRWEKMKRDQAIYHCRKYPREARESGEQCYGGVVGQWDPTLSDDLNFDQAIIDTREFLDEQERQEQEMANW